MDFYKVQNLEGTDFLIFNLVSNKKNIENEYTVIGIYQKGNPEKPNITHGRFFEKNDFFSNKKVAVIGKDVMKLHEVIHKENKEFILINNTYYEVIGIMGYDFENVLNGTIFVNMDAIDYRNNNGFYIDAANKRDIELISSQLGIQIEKEIKSLNEIKGDYVDYFVKQSLSIAVILYIFAELMIIVAAIFNLRYLKEEIYVKKILGFDFKHLFMLSMTKIIKKVIIVFFICALSSMPFMFFLLTKYGIKVEMKILVYYIYIAISYMVLVSGEIFLLYYKKYENMR